MNKSRVLSTWSVLLLVVGALWGVWTEAFIVTGRNPSPPIANWGGVKSAVDSYMYMEIAHRLAERHRSGEEVTDAIGLEIAYAVLRERFGSNERLNVYIARFDIIGAIITILLGIAGLRLSRTIRKKPPDTLDPGRDSGGRA